MPVYVCVQLNLNYVQMGTRHILSCYLALHFTCCISTSSLTFFLLLSTEQVQFIVCFSHNSIIPVLGIHLTEMLPQMYKRMRTRMFPGLYRQEQDTGQSIRKKMKYWYDKTMKYVPQNS